VENTLQIRNVSLLPEVYDIDALPENLTRRFVLLGKLICRLCFCIVLSLR
jgi:hypothetical protein